MKTISFKIRQAIELCGSPLEAKEFRQYVGREKPSGQHHARYTPADVRRVRLALLGAKRDDNLHRGLPPVITVRMTAGGVGKTTVAGNLASAYAMMGYRVLAIDGDPQATLSTMFGVNAEGDDEHCHIGHLLIEQTEQRRKYKIEDAITPIYAEGMLDLIPADISLAESDASLLLKTGREARFKNVLEENLSLLKKYDVIIVDTAPGTSFLSYNFMFACEILLVVVMLDGKNLRALSSLAANMVELTAALKKTIDFEIVANGYHPSLGHCKECLASLEHSYPNNLNETLIPQFAGFARQIREGTVRTQGTVVEQEPTSVGARAVFDLAKALVSRYGIRLMDGESLRSPARRAA